MSKSIGKVILGTITAATAAGYLTYGILKKRSETPDNVTILDDSEVIVEDSEDSRKGE